MPKLKVPYAADRTHALRSPDEAEKGHDYFCLACGDAVIFRKGKVKVAHFAHKAANICSQETIIHKTAKALVYNSITEWKSGKADPPWLKRNCVECESDISQPLPDALPGNVQSALLEFPLPNNLIADIAIINGTDRPIMAIEIRATHAVDERKASRLLIPYIELDARDVITLPRIWKPLVDNLKPFACPNCANNLKAFEIVTAAIAGRMGITLPTSYYRYLPCKCWNCGRQIIVFSWPEDDENPRKQPRPITLQYRFSKTAGHKYWANVCIYCGRMYGNHYLPFPFPFERGTTPEVFKQDIKRLANHASAIGLIRTNESKHRCIIPSSATPSLFDKPA
jgi:hypothetical protein